MEELPPEVTRCACGGMGDGMGPVTELPYFVFCRCSECKKYWMVCQQCCLKSSEHSPTCVFNPSAVTMPHNSTEYKQLKYHLKMYHDKQAPPATIDLPSATPPTGPMMAIEPPSTHPPAGPSLISSTHKKQKRMEETEEMIVEEEDDDEEDVFLIPLYMLNTENGNDNNGEADKEDFVLSAEGTEELETTEMIADKLFDAIQKELLQKQETNVSIHQLPPQPTEAVGSDEVLNQENDDLINLGVMNDPQMPGIDVVTAQGVLSSMPYTFENDRNQRFFDDIKEGKDPVANITKKAIFQCIDPDNQNYEMTERDVAKFFLFAKTVWMMPTKTRQHLAPLLGIFQTPNKCNRCKDQQCYLYCLQCQNWKDSETFLKTRRVSRFNDLRTMILERKWAYMMNIPYPEPQLVDGDCVYISIKEKVAHLMHWPVSPKFETIDEYEGVDVEHLYQSSFAQGKRDPKVDHHFTLKVWQDGFQANYSTKVERLKPWIMTGSFILRPNSEETVPFAWKGTFPIAFGLEKADKRSVMEKFYNELRELDRPGGLLFYSGQQKKNVTVRVTLVVVGCDQPERRKLCGLMGTSSTHGAAFGIIGNVKKIAEYIPSCDRCLEALMKDKKIIEQCDRCLNCEITREDSNLNVYDAPDGFPQSEGTKMKCRKATFKLLEEAAEKAHDARSSGCWSRKTTQVYLEAHSVSGRHELIGHAERVATLKYAVQYKDRYPEQYQQVMRWREADPSRYEKWPHPPIWSSGLQLSQVVCVIMHLLFLGITKHILGDVGNWLGANDKKEAFRRAAVGVLDEIKDLSLPWCKALPFNKGTAGAWVSENYLAFAKVMPWFYSMLDKVEAEKGGQNEDDFVPYDVKNTKCWKSDQCKTWLLHRGIEDPGDVKARQQKVFECQTREGGPPERIGNNPNASFCMRMIQSCFAMIAHIMVKSTTPQIIHEADCHVRIFLSLYSRFDKMMRPKEKIPEWISHANYLSLPRLIESMEMFGPLLNAWEGEVGGEAILRLIKPELKGGQSKNWHYNCMVKIVRQISMDTLGTLGWLREIIEEIAPDIPKKQTPQVGYHRYPTVEAFVAKFHYNKPLSGFMTKDKRFGICIGGPGDPHLYLIHHSSFEKKVNAQAYHRWRFEHDREPTAMVQPSDISRCVLFLPELCASGFCQEVERGMYTVIDERWMVLNSELHFVMPSVDTD